MKKKLFFLGFGIYVLSVFIWACGDAATITKRLIYKDDIDLTQTDNTTAETDNVATSTGGTMTVTKLNGSQIPWDNSYTRTIRPLNVTGDGSGRVSGYTIGAAGGTDNGVFNSLAATTISGAVTFSGTTSYVDNTINGADLVDNTVTRKKLLFSGAFVGKTSDQTATSSAWNQVRWETEVYDTGGFHSNTTDNVYFTIPSGVSYVRLSAQIYATNCYDNSVIVRIMKNGAVFNGSGRTSAIFDPDWARVDLQVSTPVVPCSQGDTFHVEYYTYCVGDASIIETDWGGLGKASWFAIEVVQ